MKEYSAVYLNKQLEKNNIYHLKFDLDMDVHKYEWFIGIASNNTMPLENVADTNAYSFQSSIKGCERIFKNGECIVEKYGKNFGRGKLEMIIDTKSGKVEFIIDDF